MKIFVADESIMLRDGIVGLLSRLEGAEIVGQAQNALEAVSAIRELKPDLVTLDIQMMGGRGIDALRTIKQISPATIVIVLTNSASLPYRKRCTEAGADFFLDKSNEFGRMKAIVQSLCENGPSRLNGSGENAA